MLLRRVYANVFGASQLGTIVYGIRNCDTVKKARAWLASHEVEYDFHDYKTAGIDRTTLEYWCKALGWEVLLNRSGSTFRKLPERDQQVGNARTAVALMLSQPSMIKRPLLDHNGSLLVGFKPELYQRALRPVFN
jgi:arsenate reductase